MASEIKVDTISEKTSAGGVTIDGLTIKDGNINESFSIVGTTPSLTLGDAGAEDIKVVFDGNAQDFHIGLDDSADDLVIGVGSTLGTTTAVAIDENAGTTFSGTVTVGEDDTGKDVKFFGASAGAYREGEDSADELRLMGASADATTSTGKLLLATSLTDINANDVLGKIDFQAPHEAGGTDAITVAASIQAVAQSTFSSSSNATDLIFYTGHSEAAAEKFRFTSQNEIGIAGANYGTDGQVLTSGGAGAAVAWEDAGGFDVSSITGATALTVEPAQTDEINISDGGTLKRLDFSHIMPVPMILVTRTNNQTINNTTATKVEWDSPIKQQGGTWSSTDYRFTPGVAGYYQSQILMRWNNFIPDAKQGGPQLYKNGSHFYTYGMVQNHQQTSTTQNGSDVAQTHPVYLDDDDYLEMMVWHNAGSSGSFGGGYNSWLVYRLVGMST